jgi:hypothetical protein
MGRDSTSSSSGEKERGWREPQHDLDLNDNFAPNESSWLQSPNSHRMGQQVQHKPSQFQSTSGPVPPSLPPLQTIMQQQQQQQQQQFPTQQQPLSPSSMTKQSTMNSASGTTKSKLPDPSLMKLSDIQGELSLRRIAYNDCFDRTSLEAKLREARLAMMKTTSPPTTTSLTTTTPRASPAEQAIFSSSFASSKSAASAAIPSYASLRGAAPNSASASSPLSSSSTHGNPFRRQSGVKNNNNRGGQNSSSSFRDNSHGIGFGDANSYYSSVGPRGGGISGSGGGDGVRLGKQRTSYGEFGGSSGRRTSSLGGSSVSGGGSTSIFTSSGGGAGSNGGREVDNSVSHFGSERKSTPFFAGGMSIKGDSSIFSSAGFVGQQGTVINAFSERDGRRSTSGKFAGVSSRDSAMSARGVSGGSLGLSGSGSGKLPLIRSPVPPSEGPRLDWPRRDPPENKHDFTTGSVLDPTITNYDASSYYDENSLKNDALPTSHNSRWISLQYQEQGLDFLSGGQEGFGAIKGIETSGGESNNRAQANIIPPPRSGVGPGNTGIIMGGDFARYSNSNVGGGQLRSSARYSGSGDGGFDGIDCED